MAEDIVRASKPLFDGRAAFSTMLVEKVKFITVALEKNEPELAYTILTNYWYLTKPHIITKNREELQKLFNESNNKINNAQSNDMETDNIKNVYCNKLLPLLIDSTSHLLLPVTDEDDDELNEEDFFK